MLYSKQKVVSEERNVIGDATITLDCNNNCIFCPRELLSNILCGKNQSEIAVSLKKVRKKSKSITLSGGEATIMPEFFSIIDICKKLRFEEISLITNGRMLSNKEFSEKFIKSGISSVGVSVYSTKEKTHESITRVHGSLKQTIKGISRIFGKISHIWANITVSKINCNDLAETVKKLYELGLREFLLINVISNKKSIINNKEHLKKQINIILSSKFPRAKVIFRGFSNDICQYIKSNDSGSNRIIIERSRFDTFIPVKKGSKKYFSEVNRIIRSKSDKEVRNITINSNNYKELSARVNKIGKGKSFVFRLASPSEIKNKKERYVSPNIVAPHLKRVLRGIKKYKIEDIPKCILPDKNVKNPISKKKTKYIECRKCKHYSECGGVFYYPNMEYKLVPITKEKDMLIEFVSEQANRKGKKPHSLGLINSTSVCNINCVFCNEGYLHKKPEHVPLKIVKKTILKLKKRGVTSINFMGGEVTTRPDILGLLDFVKKNKLKVGIATNCVSFSKKDFCRNILERIDFTEISLHTIDKKTFNMYSRSKKFGVYIKGLYNMIELNKKLKKVVIINNLIGTFNYKALSKNIKFIVKNFDKKYTAIHLRMIEKDGNANENPWCMVSFEKCKSELFKALKIARKNKFSVKVDSVPICLLGDYKEYSRYVLESIQKLNQYYFNKIRLKENMDYEKSFNKHISDMPQHKSCKNCILNFMCRGLEGNEFIDKKKLVKSLKAIKEDIRPIIKKAKKNLILSYEI